MSQDSAPFVHHYDLRDLGQGGARISIVLDGEDLDRLAQWAGVEKVESFSAKIELQKSSSSRFKLGAHLEADILQNCVVTLDPVRSQVVRDFSRELHLVAATRIVTEAPGPLTLAAGDDDAPEEIASPLIDLAAPLLEELSLGIDPYPRAPGVAFEQPQDAQTGSESPFAVLKALKTR
jgi:hypothetical protein